MTTTRLAAIFAATLLTAGLSAGLGHSALADVRIDVLKKGKKSVLDHTFADDAQDGATHVLAAGAWTWTTVLYRTEYDGRIEVCVDVQRLHKTGKRVEIGRPCVVLDGKETPSAQTRVDGKKYSLELAATRPPESP